MTQTFGNAAATGVAVLPVPSPAAAVVPVRLRMYEDSSGGRWQRYYMPVDPATANELRLEAARGTIRLDVEPLPQKDFRAAEMVWLREHHAELTARCAGEWIAIDGRELVAHAPDLVELLRLAAQAGHPNPFITAIPAQPITRLHVWSRSATA